MKQLTLVFTLLLFATSNTFAQKQKSGTKLSEVRKNKNHLDLDIKNIFNGLGGATILYKRNFEMGDLIEVNAIKLIRFSAQMNNQITFTDDIQRTINDTVFVPDHPTDIMDFQFGIGFERQKMNKNFVHYYGVDAIFNFAKSNDDFGFGDNRSVNGVINNRARRNGYERNVRTIKTGLNPFFGIKYYFTKSISLGIETGLAMVYFSQKTTAFLGEEKMVDGVVETSIVEKETVNAKGIQTKFNNLRFVTVGYTF